MARGPNPPLGLAILRVVLGVVFITHGLPKLLGGVTGTAAFLDSLGFPGAIGWAWFITLLETVGGLMLIVGFLVTPVALLLAIEMVVAIVLVHAPNGWYVVGPGQGGAEFNTLLVAGLLTLVFAGAGLAAVDRARGGRGIGEA